jgi:PadR family transcriptional regulator, regulatory protein PadR
MAITPLERVAALVAPASRVVGAIPMPMVANRCGPTAIYPPDPMAAEIFNRLGIAVAVESADQFSAYSTATATIASYFAPGHHLRRVECSPATDEGGPTRDPALLLTPRGPRPILLSTSRTQPSGGVPMPRSPKPDALRGSIDLLILTSLSLGPTHGWGIGLRIQELSRGRLDANQGSLYPALQRLEHRGDIESEWQSTENNRRARYYTLTRQGRRALGEEVDRWKRFAAAISLVLERGS